jgi:hypothetical protein
VARKHDEGEDDGPHAGFGASHMDGFVVWTYKRHGW